MNHLLKSTLLLLAILLPATVTAYDFEVDGIYYNILNDNEVKVTFKYPEVGNSYSGDVIIPATVSYNGTSYSVTVIGYEAFLCCNGLTSVTIPNSVTFIDESVFEGCTALASLIVKEGNPVYDSRENCNAIIETAINTLIFGCQNTVIPNSVTHIGSDAFRGCTGLTSVNIPNSVTSIGYHAFRNCSGLKIINVDAGNPKYDSRDNCNAIIETASNTLIQGCINTTIPNSIITIGSEAFYYCIGLTSVTIPNSVTSIGASAFSHCTSLASVTIPNSVTAIGNYAFSGLSSLTSITIPNSVTSIDAYAFSYCTSLASITIPNSVTSIKERAFSGCTRLKEVYSFISDPSKVSLGSDAFYLQDSWRYATRTLHVPKGTLAAYQTSSWFNYFGNLEEMETEGGSVTSLELDRYAAVVIEGETLQLMATILPEDALNKTLNWYTSDSGVATVDENGVVTGVSVGTATITAMTTDGSNLSASCVVTVKSLSASECLSMPDVEVLHGETVTIPVRMTNSETVLAFQTDIYLPEGFTLVTNEDDEPVITPSERLTSDHILVTQPVSNGAVRVVCYTPSMQAISGNEGDLFYLTVAVPEDAAGDYAVYLRNSRLTNADFNEIRIPDAGAVVTVKTFIPGDVNDTHSVNVADIVTTVRHVLEMNPYPFIFEAADMNHDGEVTVTDIMLIARLILYPTMNGPLHAPALTTNDDHLYGEGITLSAGETRTVSIALDNDASYSAFQLDLLFPEGLTADNFALTDRAGSHTLEVNALSDGKVRAVCYSPEIAAIGGHSGALLTFDVTATTAINGDIMVDGIELVTTDCQTVRPAAFTIGVNTVTAVNELTTDKTIVSVEYYNLAGQRLAQPATGVTLVVTTHSDGTRTTTKIIR